MKVTLISLIQELELNIAVGVRILSACLKKEGHNVRIIFLPRNGAWEIYRDKTLDEIVALATGSGLIGISLMTDDLDNVVRITQAIKKKLSVPIVWGGIHPTVVPEECLDYVDMVCIGEGEETLVELVKKMEGGQAFLDIQGMWFKHRGEIVKNQLRPLSQDLDSIPFQDYDYEDQYILSKGCIRRIDAGLMRCVLNGFYLTITSRGCPFACTYCWNKIFNKMYSPLPVVRKRSSDNVIEELKIVKNKFPFVKFICIDDDSFFSRTREEIADFAGKYKDCIKLPFWITGATPWTLTREKIATLVDAGMTDIRMGIQTGSKRIKKLYKRYHSNEQIEKAIRLINEFKDKIKLPKYDIIVDNPWETEDDTIETLLLLTRLPVPYYLFIFPLTFYPGTELYVRAKKEGILSDNSKEAWRKRHRNFQKTYLNKLLSLQKKYAKRDRSISTGMMRLLVNRKLRFLKISWLFNLVLNILIIPVGYLVREAVKDISKGDWSRITRHLKRPFKGRSLR